jgi:hypothetical protein
MEVVMSAIHKRSISLLNWAFIVILLVSLAAIPKPVSALSYKFASPTGTPTDACTYTDPCNLQQAVNTSSDGGLVYVKYGTYHPYSLPSDQVLLITQSVHLYGGWDGVSGPDPSIPDYATYTTTLDGDDARQVVTIMLASDKTVTLTGFTISHGNATGKTGICSAADAAGCGGGIFGTGGTITIEHSIIEDNVASTTTDATFRAGYGGGIYIQTPINVSIHDNIIRSNDASTATSGPSGYNGEGGGIYIRGTDPTGDLTISGNEISENEAAAESYGGWGVGLYIYKSFGSITDNYIHDNNQNQSSTGSGLYCAYSNVTFHGNRIVDNLAGDVVYLVDYNGSFDSNVVINPDSENGVLINGNIPSRFSILTNNIIAQHRMSNIFLMGDISGDAHANMYYNTLDDAPYGVFMYDYSNSIIADTIISHHSIAGIYKYASDVNNTADIAYILFHGNASDGEWDLNNHLLYGDPVYANAAGGDYHLTVGSAAIDRSPGSGYDYDFEGGPRPIGSGATPYDVGADEFWGWFLPLITRF